MMLPGVELARKRRIHGHHDGAISQPSTPPPWSQRSPETFMTSMDGEALLARKRLQEKLRSFGFLASSPTPPTTTTTSSPFSFRFNRRSHPAGSGSGGGGVPSGHVAAAGDESGRREKPMAAAAMETRSPGGDSFGSEADLLEVCSVCLEGFRSGGRKQETTLACSHRYHSGCVLPWIAAHPHCPSCRTPVVGLA